MPTDVNTIIMTIKDEMEEKGEEWEELVFYSQMFMEMPKKQQRKWLERMYDKWIKTLPKEGDHSPLSTVQIYTIGKASLAFLHYKNLYEDQHTEEFFHYTPPHLAVLMGEVKAILRSRGE